jgi:hypothetical protein
VVPILLCAQAPHGGVRPPLRPLSNGLLLCTLIIDITPTPTPTLMPKPTVVCPSLAARTSSGQPPSSARGCPSFLGRPRASSRHRPPMAACPSSATCMPPASVVRPWPPIVDRHHPPSGHPPAFAPIPRLPRCPTTAEVRLRTLTFLLELVICPCVATASVII